MNFGSAHVFLSTIAGNLTDSDSTRLVAVVGFTMAAR